MKKINLIILFLAILTSKIFSEDIKIYAPVAQKMLIDKNDYVRYSPVNMFDNKSDSVFAVTFDEINKKRPLLEIYFADPATFDSISIKAGYFDKRYFEKNDRIKNLTLKVYNCENVEVNENVELQDEMTEQNIYNGKKVIASKIEIYVNEVYSGSKWNDLVISDLNFSQDKKQKPVSFDIGECLFAFTYHKYEYDDQDRLVHHYYQYGKAGADDEYYKYEDGKIFRAYVGMEDDPANKKYEQIDSIKEVIPKGTEFFYKNGNIIAEKYTRYKQYAEDTFYISQYIYNDKKQLVSIIRICENDNWGDKIIKYTYDEKGLVVSKIGYYDATIYTKRYE